MTRQLSNQTQQQTATTSPLSSGILQRKCVSCGQHTIAGGECEGCQKKRLPLQRRAVNQAEPAEVPPIVGEVLRSPGQSLDPGTRAFMEPGFGHDFSRVRVHTDAKAAESAKVEPSEEYFRQSFAVQPKLSVGQPGDKYEREADTLAAKVMSMAAPVSQQPIQREMASEEEEVQTNPLVTSITPLVQRKAMPEEEQVQTKPLTTGTLQREAMPEEEEPVQMRPLANTLRREAMPEEEEPLQTKPLLQRAMDASLLTGGNLESRLNSSKGRGSPLPDEVRLFMELRFGADFSQVRVHTGSEAVQMNQDLNAQAFTHGRDIFFGEGKLPGNNELTAHELTHVVQQNGRTVQPQQVIQRVPRPIEEPLATWWDRLRALGIRENRISNLETLEAMDSAEVERLFDVLEDLMRNDVRTVGTGIRRGWNGLQDDLGPPEQNRRSTFPTPLHYVQNLERLSGAASSGSHRSYTEFRRHAPRMRLAGTPINVHPRALYFVAAAQVGMDVAARLEAGEGHYIAPALYNRAFREIRRRVNELSRQLARQLRLAHRRRRPRPRTEAQIQRISENITDIVDELHELADAIRDNRDASQHNQAQGRGQDHPDENIDSWLDEAPPTPVGTTSASSRLELFLSLSTPSDGEQQASFISGLSAALQGLPGSRYGAGAMDLHGTMHAMGLAIDIGTARDSHAENRGIPENYWPFLYHLMDNYPSRDNAPLRGVRARAIHTLQHTQRRQLSGLIHDHGKQAADAIQEEYQHLEESGNLRPSREEQAADRSAIGATVRAMRRLLQGMNSFANGQGYPDYLYRLQDEAVEIWNQLRETIRTYPQHSPQGLQNKLAELRDSIKNLMQRAIQEIDRRLDSLRQRLDRANEVLAEPDPLPEPPVHMEGVRYSSRHIPQRIRNRLSPRHRRQNPHLQQRFDWHIEQASIERAFNHINRTRERLHQIHDQAEDLQQHIEALDTRIGSGAQDRWRAQSMQQLHNLIRDGGFRRWLGRAIEHGIYTQPDAFVEGLEQVHSFRNNGHQFYGGHHFNIAPREVITNDHAYRDALRRDMQSRQERADEFDRIVAYMLEFSHGRRALSPDPSVQDRILVELLTEFRPDWRDQIPEGTFPEASENN